METTKMEVVEAEKPAVSETDQRAIAEAYIKEQRAAQEVAAKVAGEVQALLNSYGFDLQVQHVIQHNIVLTPRQGVGEEKRKELAEKIQAVLDMYKMDLTSQHNIASSPRAEAK